MLVIVDRDQVHCCIIHNYKFGLFIDRILFSNNYIGIKR